MNNIGLAHKHFIVQGRKAFRSDENILVYTTWSYNLYNVSYTGITLSNERYAGLKWSNINYTSIT